MADPALLRPAEFDDLDQLYSICLRTGAAGADASAMYADADLLGHVYVGPYVLMDTAFGFVLESARPERAPELLGYALATPDTAAFEDECEQGWWPALRRRYPLTGAGPEADAALIDLIHHPRRSDPALLADYPAHLHVDLLPEAQGRGGGRALMAAVEAELRARGSAGVHLGVAADNVRAHGFYEHLGYRRFDGDGWTYVKSLA